MTDFLIWTLSIVWLLVSIFMILVILVQRGRGGGLAGALGGLGGSSAFGTRAGDVFTKITVVVFLTWLFLGGVLVLLMNPSTSALDELKAREAKEAAAPAESTAKEGQESEPRDEPILPPLSPSPTPADSEPAVPGVAPTPAETEPEPSASPPPSETTPPPPPPTPEAPSETPPPAETTPSPTAPEDSAPSDPSPPQ